MTPETRASASRDASSVSGAAVRMTIFSSVSPSPSTFDRQKLDWLNQQWINHQLTVEDLAARVMPWLVEAGTIGEGPADETHPRFAEIVRVTRLLKDRIHFLTEAPDLMSYFLQDELPDYDTALLVPPGDVAALAGALRRLSGDAALAARLGEQGRALYEREFTLPVFAERVAAIHAEVGL